jgi:hypothetical protein
MTGNPQATSRRQAFALAAALTLTVLTGGAALTGLRHGVSHAPSGAPVVQLAQATAPAPPHGERSD